MNSEKNLYNKIKKICINQLYKANTAASPYKARYADSSVDDEINHKIEISKEDARAHVEALIKPDEYKNCNDIFRRLLISGQNRNRMPKVINFMGREEKFKEILCGNGAEKFSYKKILQSFCNDTQNKDKAANILLNKFKENFKIKENTTEADDKQKKYKSLWHQYALFIIDAALFMEEICEDADITEGIDENCQLEKFKASLDAKASKKFSGKYKLQDYIASEISGIGFTLACDFLKEIGYPIAKPDTHVKKFMQKYCGKEMSEQEIIDEFNKLSQCVPNKDNEIEIENKQYALDKLIWLCCSGNYYKKGKFERDIIVEPKSLRDLFLEKL